MGGAVFLPVEGRAAGTAVEPKDDRIGFRGRALRLYEPVVQMLSSASVEVAAVLIARQRFAPAWQFGDLILRHFGISEAACEKGDRSEADDGEHHAEQVFSLQLHAVGRDGERGGCARRTPRRPAYVRASAVSVTP
eukprot:COSAG02_NODE_1150_length_14208_cov_5.805231_6_plen_136_part_00